MAAVTICSDFTTTTTTKSLQSCPTLCDPIDGSPPGSTNPGILQARTLEWGAIALKSVTVSPSISHEVMGPDAMILVFWMLT